MKSAILCLFFIYSFSSIAQETESTSVESKPMKKTLIKEAIVTDVTKTMVFEKEQTIDSTNTVIGFQENKDERIDLLIQDYLENKKTIGYRVQIFSSSSNKWEAVKARSEFLKKYPERKSYLIYQAPNFKVRIGDYPDRLMANEYLELIKEEFPTAFIVKDEIELEVE